MLQTNSKNNLQQRNWMVIYTRSRFEKKISNTLNDVGITGFCPVIKSVKKWADRKKTVETPLFPSYVFVKATANEMLKVKEIPGVVSFISNCGKSIVLKDSEIERIKTIVNTHADAEMINIQTLDIGSKVKITDGLLLNYEGVVNQVMGKAILMTIEQLNCVIAVKVNINQISLNAAS